MKLRKREVSCAGLRTLGEQERKVGCEVVMAFTDGRRGDMDYIGVAVVVVT